MWLCRSAGRWCAKPLQRHCWAWATKLMLLSLSPAKTPGRTRLSVGVSVLSVVTVIV